MGWILFVFLLSCNDSARALKTKLEKVDVEKTRPEVDKVLLRQKATEALSFCTKHNFHDKFCILIDMSVHSGIKRFMIWDFEQNKAIHSFLVGHGSGKYPWSHDYSKENPQFSNVENSHCTSLGKYKIGERAPSQWGVGIKYVLHGLESTNNNAFKRFVVFHSWEDVPEMEVYPAGTPEGWGCPILAPSCFNIADSMLKSCSKPVLMWIYTK